MHDEKTDQRSAGKKYYFTCAGVWLGIGAFTSIVSIFISGRLEYILGSYLLSIPGVSFSLITYAVTINFEKKFAQSFPGQTPEEIERILENSEQLDEAVFLSDKYIFEFNYIMQSTEISDIISINKYNNNEVKWYHIALNIGKVRPKYITFSSKGARNLAFDRLADKGFPVKKSILKRLRGERYGKKLY